MRILVLAIGLAIGTAANAQETGPTNQDIMDLFWEYWQAERVRAEDNATLVVSGSRYRVVPEFGKVWEFETPEKSHCEPIRSDDGLQVKWECTYMWRVRDARTHHRTGRRLSQEEIIEQLNEQEFREVRQNMIVFDDDGNFSRQSQ